MPPGLGAVVLAVAVLGGCSTGVGPGTEDPLADGCRVVEDHASRRVAQDEVRTLSAFSTRLDAEADALSTSDAAELRPLARAAAAVVQTPEGAASDLAYADYRRVLGATLDVCRAAAVAER